MKKCLIVCAGDFDAEGFLAREDENSFVIAADAGYAHLEKLNITPDLVIGDFDSLGSIPENSIILPVEKDLTDSFAAADEGLSRGFCEFAVYGALGGKRISHSLANIRLLAYLAQKGARASLEDANCRIRLLGEGAYSYEKGEKGDLSFISFSEKATLSLEGMKYCAKEREIKNSDCLCVSNSFTGEGAKLTVHSGQLLEIWENR